MRTIWWVILLALLSACSAPEIQSTLTASLPTPIPTPTDRYEVKAWVSEPDPKPGRVVWLTGSLIKNGVYLNGIMMSGYWQQPEEDAPQQHCYAMTSYQRGRCIIIVEGFQEDVFVPLEVKFIYKGISFTAETGFTPRGK